MAIPHKYLFLLLIGVAVVLEVFADILLKKWSLSARWLFLALGIGIYLLGTISWAYSLKYEYLSKAIVIFTIANLTTVTLVSIFYFDEQISLANKIGILLGIVSIALIEV